MNLFPRSDTNIARNEGTAAAPAGRVFQGQFGVKAGKRFRKFGIFAKARPGFVGFTEVTKLIGTTILGPFGVLNQTFNGGHFRSGKEAYFSTDLGGVVEFYASRRIFTRVDVGDTIISLSSLFWNRVCAFAGHHQPDRPRQNITCNSAPGGLQVLAAMLSYRESFFRSAV